MTVARDPLAKAAGADEAAGAEEAAGAAAAAAKGAVVWVAWARLGDDGAVDPPTVEAAPVAPAAPAAPAAPSAAGPTIGDECSREEMS